MCHIVKVQVRILAGADAAMTLTQQKQDDILGKLKPYLVAGNYDEAAVYIGMGLAGADWQSKTNWTIIWIWVALISICVISICFVLMR